LQQGKFQHNYSVKEFTDRAKDTARPSLIKHNITELKPQDKLASANSCTEWPDGKRPWPEKKERGREEDDTLTDAHVLVWTAWQGSARAAGQRLPEGVFTTAHQEHRITGMLTHTPGSPRRSTTSTTESRRGVEVSSDREAIPE
jgi:hypothetical protein